MSAHEIHIQVNGEPHQTTAPARQMLSDFLRDTLYLTGTKRGCETGTCGACTILKDGQPVKSCLSLTLQSDGCTITTVEGLANGDHLHPLQQAFLDAGGLQCGYCTPGFLMSSFALLAENKSPSEAEVRRALNGHLCRCTGYSQIVESVLKAAETLRGN